MGSLRVLREAKTRGIIPHVRPILDELIAAGMYISEALYEAFLRQLDEAEEHNSLDQRPDQKPLENVHHRTITGSPDPVSLCVQSSSLAITS